MAPGKLHLIATPIGNLEDITVRALRILKEVDLIACEDTRHTAKLLAHYGIHTPRESYHEHNEASRTPQLLALLRQGKQLALVTDAGTPLLSDPGYTLVAECIKEEICIVPLPGPAAALAALAGSGLPAGQFFFAGFLSSKASLRRKQLQGLSSLPCTLIFYEAPHRLLASLQDMIAILGPRRACLARELTKIHEEWLRSTLPSILVTLQARPRIQGEITIVIAGGEVAPPSPPSPVSLRQDLHQEIEETGAPHKEALRAVARRRGISRKEAYRLLLEETD
jgi:16S rRNA (cytidine1402-2'-O)-methyltransferase